VKEKHTAGLKEAQQALVK